MKVIIAFVLGYSIAALEFGAPATSMAGGIFLVAASYIIRAFAGIYIFTPAAKRAR